LPVEVFGSGPNTTVARHLEAGEVAAGEGDELLGGGGLRRASGSTKAQGVSPQLASGRATTAASSTAGCL
jgi:hypothetical protein